MQKIVRSFALVAAVALATVPAARANQTGCNPHPQVATIAAPSTMSVLVSTVLSLLGM